MKLSEIVILATEKDVGTLPCLFTSERVTVGTEENHSIECDS